MLNENIKNIRTQKGMTQNELAIRLNVVRQTVSKWEKGLSVPDAEMLAKIAEVLETDVATLLGSTFDTSAEQSDVAKQLARVNEQLIIHNRRSRRMAILIVTILLAILLWLAWNKISETRFYRRLISQPKPLDLSYTCEAINEDSYCLANFKGHIITEEGRLFICNYYDDEIVITFEDENGDVAFERPLEAETLDTFFIKPHKTYYLEIKAKEAKPKEEVRVLIFEDYVPNDVWSLYFE